ncbi:MAG: AAA-like domain-containing protein [Leptospiraceae bacterium]|nr:AAA-like domain-containing protein [Leptospiraceae bacterium]MCP5495598.1 AAA-like domain-containing protein [Leptospiraceae bacterium]
MKRYFNTSGPNNPKEHYTLYREHLLEKGKKLVFNQRYFTIWAPRQSGKSTYSRLLAKELEKEGYSVAHINFENYRTESFDNILKRLIRESNKFWNTNFTSTSIPSYFFELENIQNRNFVLIIDEVEGINPDYLGTFLHSIRNAYHSRDSHSLKSVILVGVSNITGIMQDHASPFNISDELNIPYFSNEETVELLTQHETETGQVFEQDVKSKISEITANQPGLVNGFAKQLVDRNPNKAIIGVEDYEIVEDWYLNKAIDKNIANILKIAKQYRNLMEKLLFKENPIPFKIDDPSIEKLYVNGLITYDENNYIVFWVPLYKKRLHDALYPYSNGEGEKIASNMLSSSYLMEDRTINFDKLIDAYKSHIKLRSFRPFREKDEKGRYISIPEAAMIYSFETFISIFLREIEGRLYRESYVSLGNTDIIINVLGHEYIIETKKYYSPGNFQKGKKQLAYYCNRADLKEGVYIVFVDTSVNPDFVSEGSEEIEDVLIRTYLIWYDEEKDF